VCCHNGQVAIAAAKSAIAPETPIAALADPRSQNVNTVAFSPNGKTLATADENGLTYLWKVTGEG
jgi:WD40 repeat protein